jgi:hypothetical protein
MTTIRKYGTPLVREQSGEYLTEDGRYRVFSDDEYITYCEGPHVVRLPFGKWTTEWDYDKGCLREVKGYQCPGNEEHHYTRWNIWDYEADNYAFGESPGAFKTFAEAAQELTDKLKGGAK